MEHLVIVDLSREAVVAALNVEATTLTVASASGSTAWTGL